MAIDPTTPQSPPHESPTLPVYLDCAATTPLDPRVRDLVLHYLDTEYGNAGSHTHVYGQSARRAVEHARDQVAAILDCTRGEVIFTSGATESDNLAILGLADHGRQTNRRHIITSAIEHHAVLAPMEFLADHGFDVTFLPPTPGGFVHPDSLRAALRPDTLLVSILHANNETGILQPIADFADLLANHPAFFHVDAAQSAGLFAAELRHPRIDLISLSGHKLHAPKGVGALIARRRDRQLPPLAPLLHGGGQERGLRSGTHPVPLIAGLGLALELAVAETPQRRAACEAFGERLLEALRPLNPIIHGDRSRALPHILNLSFPPLLADAVIDAWQTLAAISTGSACTTQSRTCSHVLSAMRLPPAQLNGAVRLSWSHLTPAPSLAQMVQSLHAL